MRRHLSPLDRGVGTALAALAVLIALSVGRGDHVGVQLLRTTPAEAAGRWSVITVQFSEAMDRASVVERLHTEPLIQGEATWAGSRLIFRPAYGLDPGTTYTFAVKAGAMSESGRSLLAEHRFSFRVHGPRVAYLAPEDGDRKDIWVRDAAGREPPEQVTQSPHGVIAFDVSPDGSRIAYAERKDTGTAVDLRLLDLDTRDVRPLTNCGESICTNPAWSPDGSQIAYERLASSRFEPTLATTSSRVWLLEPDLSPPRTRPLFGDAQTPPNYKPRWSPDGRRLVVSQLAAPPNRNPGMVVVNLADESSQFVPTAFGSMGTFAPDGLRLLYPAFAVQEGEMRTALQIADLGSGESIEVPGLSQAHEALADWRPDGSALVVARRSAPGEEFRGRQLYLVHPRTGATQPLVQDPAYDHSYVAWDAAGQHLVLQRGAVWTGGPEIPREQRAQVWVHDTTSGKSTLIATNAFHPRWIP